MSILSCIGNTSLVDLNNINKNLKVRLMGKLEGANPVGSVKDRPAYYLITKAENEGKLTKDKIILEPTSGNTGIAIGMIGATKGYSLTLIMPNCVSVERQRILEAFGDDIILTPECDGTDGSINKAH